MEMAIDIDHQVLSAVWPKRLLIKGHGIDLGANFASEQPFKMAYLFGVGLGPGYLI